MLKYFVKRLECQEPLGLGNSSITDGQLSSSSQLDDAHTAMQGRLNSNATGGSGGSWSAGNNNSSQWLQIDLLDQSNNVTRVATQGRHDASQWVTKYRLQYSEDGKIFHFYREPGDTAGKVIRLCLLVFLFLFLEKRSGNIKKCDFLLILPLHLQARGYNLLGTTLYTIKPDALGRFFITLLFSGF